MRSFNLSWLDWVKVKILTWSKCNILSNYTYGKIKFWQNIHLNSNVFSSVQFSRSVVSSTLWPHGLQHTRLPCPSPSPGACSNPCPFSWWCYPTISSSVIPFSSCIQYFPTSGSFLMSQLFASGGQSIGVSASASVLPIVFRTDFL